MVKNERYFCSNPFEWFEVTQLDGRGWVYLCCPSWLDTPVGNLKYQSVKEIWNSKKAKKIRHSILQGSFKYCNHGQCPHLQTKSGVVRKASEPINETIRNIIEKHLTELPFGPKKIICTYDQSCNLSCPSCRTTTIVETNCKPEILSIENKLRKEALKEAEYLLLAGAGDPFGSPFFRKWLQNMKRQEMPKLERIHLHTNGQLWTPQMWETIAEDIRRLVKSAEISIDAATDETYSQNRRGGDFSRLLENLEFISELRRTSTLERLKISMVVQENNFREMLDFISLGSRFNADEIYFSQIVDWGTFSSADFKKRAVHIPSHPNHQSFISFLQDKMFDNPIVNLGNLNYLRGPTVNPATHKLRSFREKMQIKIKSFLSNPQ